jgi:hypothetical protein
MPRGGWRPAGRCRVHHRSRWAHPLPGRVRRGGSGWARAAVFTRPGRLTLARWWMSGAALCLRSSRLHVSPALIHRRAGLSFRLVLGNHRRTGALSQAHRASRHAVRCAHSQWYASERSSRTTGQRSAEATLWPQAGISYGAGLPPARAGFPGTFLVPHGLGTVLEQTLHRASPIAPRGLRKAPAALRCARAPIR